MKGFYSQLWRWGLGSATGILLTGGLLGGNVAIAQRTVQLNLPNLSAPGNRESGSTRSTTCIDPSDRLVALIPETNYGLTQSGHPTFYFYLPTTTAEQLKFVLLNSATNELVYEGRFRLAGTGGIASVSLPDNGVQQALAVNEDYVWYLAIVCDETDPSADIVTEAYVRRVEALDLTVETPAADLPALYAEAGLWYDALAAAADRRTTDSPAAWNALLDAVALNDFIAIELLTEDAAPVEQSAALDHQ